MNRVIIRECAESRAARKEWAKQWRACWCCGTTRPDFRGWQVHHIIRGAGRSDEVANFSFLCPVCHDRAEDRRVRDEKGEYLPRLTLAHCLWLKKKHDPLNYSWDRLKEIKGYLPEPEEP